MEPERPDPPRPEAPVRTELRAFAQLRDRVEAAAREVERLREENAALAARIAELQAGGAAPAAAPTLFSDAEDAEKLKAKIQGFIEAIDRVLSAPEPAAARRDA
jgi:predicted RNase H-like nuclease (RuvC/YqgF family)